MADNHFTKREQSRSCKNLVSEHLGAKVNQLISFLQRNSQVLDDVDFSYDDNLLPLLQQEFKTHELDEGESFDFREAHEHWVVSDWLGDQLTQKGEMVGQLFGLTIWGRTATGQAVYLDDVIQTIHAEQHPRIQRGVNAR